MSAVTFIYRVGNSAPFIGKYVVDKLSDDHEALDLEIHPVVLSCLNNYRVNKGYRSLRVYELRVGVLSYIDLTTGDCSRHEVKSFDFYHRNGKSYMNGREVTSDSQTFKQQVQAD